MSKQKRSDIFNIVSAGTLWTLPKAFCASRTTGTMLNSRASSKYGFSSFFVVNVFDTMTD